MARFQARSAYWKKSGRYQQSRLEAWSFMNDRKLAANIQGEGLEGFSNLRMAETKPVFSPSSLFFYDEMDTSDSKRVMEDNSINEFHEGDSKARDFEDVLSSSDQSNSVVAR
ncbi:hypothetical protein V6N13_133650 [Hibiscus sabdariffa]